MDDARVVSLPILDQWSSSFHRPVGDADCIGEWCRGHRIVIDGNAPTQAILESSLNAIRRQLLIAIVVGHVLASLALGFTSAFDQEIFPIFSWRLFSRVPNHSRRHTLLIQNYNGADFPENCFLEKSEIIKESELVTVSKLTQRLGTAVRRMDKSQERALLEQLTTNYLTGTVRFQLVEIEYDPIARRKSGELIRSRLVKSYAFPDIGWIQLDEPA
jgi:hypothetical protein